MGHTVDAPTLVKIKVDRPFVILNTAKFQNI